MWHIFGKPEEFWVQKGIKRLIWSRYDATLNYLLKLVKKMIFKVWPKISRVRARVRFFQKLLIRILNYLPTNNIWPEILISCVILSARHEILRKSKKTCKNWTLGVPTSKFRGKLPYDLKKVSELTKHHNRVAARFSDLISEFQCNLPMFRLKIIQNSKLPWFTILNDFQAKHRQIALEFTN